MGWISKIIGYFIGILIVLFGFLWIIALIPLYVIIDGLIGLNIVILGFCITYSVHKARIQEKNQQEFQLEGSINNQ
jgi:uncharacterized membrane protein